MTGTGTDHDLRADDLRADDLRLAYDAKVVVDGLSLAIPPGKITVIVGANACGKSTLLRALARLLKPKAGTVHLDARASSISRPATSPSRSASCPSR